MKVRHLLLLALALVTFLLSACADDDERDAVGTTGADAAAGRVRADGSSTIGPFANQAADLFEDDNPEFHVTVGVSGTRGGFERFCAGDTDIANASRLMTEEEERACSAARVEHLHIPVANDAITVITSAENDWVECLTTEQLERIWQPGSTIMRWNEVDPRFPSEQLRLFGPDTASGTFAFFTSTINGKRGASRSDYTSSDDDNVTVGGVAHSRGGLGYLGYSYYAANRGALKALAVDGGGGCVRPSVETVQDGSYEPLSRPLYVYVNRESFDRPAVQEFVRFMLNVDAPLIATVARLIPLTEAQLDEASRTFLAAEG